jgi:hypothetical protein
VPGHSADVADHVGLLDIHPRQRLLHAPNVATGTPHLDDEQRRMPMAPESGERDPEETMGGRESGALMNRAFEDSDLMAQSQDLGLEVKARTCDEKREQGSGHRRREFGEQYNSFPPRSFRILERHNSGQSRRYCRDRECGRLHRAGTPLSS